MREIAAEEELVDDLMLMSQYQGVIRLPGAQEQAADIGVDVGVLT